MSTNFEAMTDAEINKWAAERDGWRVFEYKADKYYPWRSVDARTDGITCHKSQKHALAYLNSKTAFATSADACLALAERWGMTWTRKRKKCWPGPLVTVNLKFVVWRSFYEIEGRSFARTLLNALCLAKEAQEAAG